MARETLFQCIECKNEISSWDDGNPYYFTRTGKKKYAYHPDPKSERCVGNDSLYLCLGYWFIVSPG